MANPKPHIILIMTDQQRIDTIGAWGNRHMRTPAMDRLAAHGTSFRNAFCPGATCVASRAAIFTGRFAPGTGVYSFVRWEHQPNWVQELASADYHCVNIGKMHFMPYFADRSFHERVVVENPADRPGPRDDDWGHHLAEHGVKRPLDRNKTDPEWYSKFQGVPWTLDEKLHSDVFIGEKAVQWLESHSAGEKPTFLQIGFVGPHEPYDPLPRHYALYEDAEVPEPVFADDELDQKPPQHRAHEKFFAEAPGDGAIRLQKASPEDFRRMRRHYYAKVTTVDEQIGKVLDALERQNYLQNSLVIFCSDHGDMLGDHRLPYKWLMYDGVTHVPLIIWDTRRTDQRTESSDLVSLIDLGPTVLSAAGVEAPVYYDGRSLLEYMDASTEPVPTRYVFACDNYLTMVRSSRHKLVHYLFQEPGELYDLELDPHELKNLWNDPAYDSVKRELKEALLEWSLESAYRHAGLRVIGSPTAHLRDPRRDPRLHGDGALHGLQSLPLPAQREVDLP